MTTKKGQIIKLLQEIHKDFEDRTLQNDEKYSLEQIVRNYALYLFVATSIILVIFSTSVI